jgi:hypothetical protein
MTIEHAAVTLGLSVRTVNRHITAGKLQSRLQDGRREVLIESAAVGAGSRASDGRNADFTGEIIEEDGSANTRHQTGDFVGGAADSGVDYETVLALADNAADKAELAVAAYQTLAKNADERVRANRRLSAVSWSLVGALAVIAIVSVGWTTHRLTRAADESASLQRQVTAASAMAEEADHECDDLRKALADARDHAARAEGSLAAYRETSDTSRRTTRQTATTEPTTRPTIVDRIASILGN